MTLYPPTNRPAKIAGGALEPAVTTTPVPLREPVGLEDAGIDTRAILLGLLGPSVSSDLFPIDLATPEAAKRKVDEDEDADDDDEADDDDDTPADDDDEEEDADEEEDLDEDEDEEEEDDDDEDEEDDDFDDPDDDFDDDDDEDDFDDDE